MVKKKKKDTFHEFRSNDKSAYTTIKTTLKSVLHNHKEVQPLINNLVFEMNDLMIHSYQFIRLYVLNCYNNNLKNQKRSGKSKTIVGESPTIDLHL